MCIDSSKNSATNWIFIAPHLSHMGDIAKPFLLAHREFSPLSLAKICRPGFLAANSRLVHYLHGHLLCRNHPKSHISNVSPRIPAGRRARIGSGRPRAHSTLFARPYHQTRWLPPAPHFHLFSLFIMANKAAKRAAPAAAPAKGKAAKKQKTETKTKAVEACRALNWTRHRFLLWHMSSWMAWWCCCCRHSHIAYLLLFIAYCLLAPLYCTGAGCPDQEVQEGREEGEL